MNHNEGILRVINSTSQTEARIVEALTDYGDGHMGVGLLKFADWGVRAGTAKGLQKGRIEGVLVASLLSTAIVVTSGYFLNRQFQKEERRNQEEMWDILDDIMAAQDEKEHNTPAEADTLAGQFSGDTAT